MPNDVPDTEFKKTVSFLSCCEQLMYFRDLSITLGTIEQSFKNVYKEYNLPTTYAKQWRLWNFSKGLRAIILVNYSISLKTFLLVVRNRNRKVFACMEKYKYADFNWNHS